jgi:hypothetical protein
VLPSDTGEGDHKHSETNLVGDKKKPFRSRFLDEPDPIAPESNVHGTNHAPFLPPGRRRSLPLSMPNFWAVSPPVERETEGPLARQILGGKLQKLQETKEVTEKRVKDVGEEKNTLPQTKRTAFGAAVRPQTQMFRRKSALRVPPAP